VAGVHVAGPDPVTAFLTGCAPLRVKHEVVLPAREGGDVTVFLLSFT